jgi:hypothetical protein
MPVGYVAIVIYRNVESADQYFTQFWLQGWWQTPQTRGIESRHSEMFLTAGVRFCFLNLALEFNICRLFRIISTIYSKPCTFESPWFHSHPAWREDCGTKFEFPRDVLGWKFHSIESKPLAGIVYFSFIILKHAVDLWSDKQFWFFLLDRGSVWVWNLVSDIKGVT